jgi:hypothetical protein
MFALTDKYRGASRLMMNTTLGLGVGIGLAAASNSLGLSDSGIGNDALRNNASGFASMVRLEIERSTGRLSGSARFGIAFGIQMATMLASKRFF